MRNTEKESKPLTERIKRKNTGRKMEKAIIYLRTSTEDQEPENQKRECLEFAKNRGYEIEEILLEKLSGFKPRLTLNHNSHMFNICIH